MSVRHSPIPGLNKVMFHRASLVPVYAFGENELFKQVDNPPGSLLRRMQGKFKTAMGFAPPLFYGRGIFNYTFGVLPKRHPVHVVGKTASATIIINSFSIN